MLNLKPQHNFTYHLTGLLVGNGQLCNLNTERSTLTVEQPLTSLSFTQPEAYILGNRQYELKNHLGNVLATVSGYKNPTTNTTSLLTAQDYYPFGSIMPCRSFGNGYRFGFNGKETDPEWSGNKGATYDYGFRIYDSRIAKFLSVDPLTKSYHWYTPYQFAGNKPINSIDLDGLEEKEAYVMQMAMCTDAYLKFKKAEEVREIVAIFKMNYMHDLPHKFIYHYAYAKGEKYPLTEKEMEQLHVQPRGLNSFGFGKEVQEKVKGLRTGESIYLDLEAQNGIAATSGTLNQFTIKVRGTFTWVNDNEFEFKGEMQFYDKWDFNPDSEEDKQKRKEQTGYCRSEKGEFQTRIANMFLPGVKFEIESDWIKISQKSGEEYFDWFKGKDSSKQTSEYEKVKGNW